MREGEIFGLAGLIGSGREELMEALYGLRAARAGVVRLGGRRVRLPSPSRAVREGIVLVPRDRRHDGLVLPMTVAENITLATLDRVSRAGIERRERGARGWPRRRSARSTSARPTRTS